MASRHQVQKRMQELGCIWEEDCWGYITVYAPKGKRLVANHAHCIVYRGRDLFTGRSARVKAYGQIMEDLSFGLMDCEDPDCDYCKGDEE